MARDYMLPAVPLGTAGNMREAPFGVPLFCWCAASLRGRFCNAGASDSCFH